MELKRLDFESRSMRHEGETKLVPQMRNAHTRARQYIKKVIAASYDIVFLCSNMQIEADKQSIIWNRKNLIFNVGRQA